ncbi:MAG: polysaccharide deacetylase family protein [Oscillospiraceae bacterium]|jgi:hypothetical protein|nr:polysaccharide deacetylase family protein [Oscillospiraceae bacterium]
MVYTYFYFKKIIVRIFAITFFSLFFFIAIFCFIPNFKTDVSDEEIIEIKLPIIMYHGLVKEKKFENALFINVDLFEEDLKYLIKNNFNSIFVKDLINYVYEDVPLPENPIMITFDDGYSNNFLYGLPLLKKYNQKIVFSPIGDCIGNSTENFQYVTWDQIKEMVETGLVEIQNHSYNTHNLKERKDCLKMKYKFCKKYEEELKIDVMKFQKSVFEHLGQTPEAFVYPFDILCFEAKSILKCLGFKTTFSCKEKINKIFKHPDSIYYLYLFLRPNNITTEKFFKKIYN